MSYEQEAYMDALEMERHSILDGEDDEKMAVFMAAANIEYAMRFLNAIYLDAERCQELCDTVENSMMEFRYVKMVGILQSTIGGMLQTCDEIKNNLETAMDAIKQLTGE